MAALCRPNRIGRPHRVAPTQEQRRFPIPKPITFPSQPPTERAFLVGVELKRPRNEFPIDDSLDELERLAETAGLQVVGSAVQHIERINPATLIGKGKLNEIIASRADAPFDVLLFDEELHPNQQREIETIKR